MTQPDPTPRTSWPWTRILLIASLALNLMIVGAVGGAVWTFADRAKTATGGPGGLVFLRALPREDRAAFRDTARQAIEVAGLTRRDERESIAAFVALLRADTLDTEALSAVLEARGNRNMVRETALRSGLLATISEMTPDARLAYADRLEELQARGKRKHSRD